ncbi:MAG TPA: hypothetical protein PKE32_05410 [Miltoncostaeaceae bacterium]|nr:hypothetical protein [Miltoncostaeaceae bacterium]
MKHGAFTPAVRDPLAARMIAELLDEPELEYLRQPQYRAAVAAWGRAEAAVYLIDKWVGDHGMLDEEGTPTPAARYLGRLEGIAARARERLGLDPRSRADLGRAVTATRLDLAQIMADYFAADDQQPRSGSDGEG